MDCYSKRRHNKITMEQFTQQQKLIFNVHGNTIIGKFLSEDNNIVTIEVISDSIDVSQKGEKADINKTFLVENIETFKTKSALVLKRDRTGYVILNRKTNEYLSHSDSFVDKITLAKICGDILLANDEIWRICDLYTIKPEALVIQEVEINITPISAPAVISISLSDDDIETESFKRYFHIGGAPSFESERQLTFVEGAKWGRNKTLGKI